MQPGKPSPFRQLSLFSTQEAMPASPSEPPDATSIILSLPHIPCHHTLLPLTFQGELASSLTSHPSPLHPGWGSISTEIATAKVIYYLLLFMSTANFLVFILVDPWVTFGTVDFSILMTTLSLNWKQLPCAPPSSWENLSIYQADSLVFVHSLNSGAGCVESCSSPLHSTDFPLHTLIHSYAWNWHLYLADSQSYIYIPNCLPETSDPYVQLLSDISWMSHEHLTLSMLKYLSFKCFPFPGPSLW